MWLLSASSIISKHKIATEQNRNTQNKTNQMKEKDKVQRRKVMNIICEKSSGNNKLE